MPSTKRRLFLQVLLGRATEDVVVDIDLGREGHANKISRRQVRFLSCCSFKPTIINLSLLHCQNTEFICFCLALEDLFLTGNIYHYS